MITFIFEWIVVGSAHRIVSAGQGEIKHGGVMPDEALILIATERGRHARYFAQEIVNVWGHSSR